MIFWGVRALRAGEGLLKNGFQSAFLGPYDIPHANKCQAQMIFIDFNLSIRLTKQPSLTSPQATIEKTSWTWQPPVPPSPLLLLPLTPPPLP